LIEAARGQRIREAYTAYRGLSVEEQEAVCQELVFATPTSAYEMEIRRHGLAKSQALIATFFEWLGKTLWSIDRILELMFSNFTS
jgi:hypothetical protein